MARLILLAAAIAGISSSVATTVLAAEGSASGSTVLLEVSPGELPRALERARGGETLKLLAGTHPGPITIRVPLRLVGKSGAIVMGSGEGTVLTLAANGIEVRGLKVRGSGDDLSQDDAAVMLREAEAITVEDCTIETRGFGIYLKAGGGHHIIRNEIRGDRSRPVARRGNGIHLWNTTSNEIRENRVADVRDGVYLSFAHENRILGNEGSGLRYGIHYMYSERNVLRENGFHSCTGGIALMFSLGNRIEENVTAGNRDFGILCQQLERSTLVANRVSRNGRGFYIENSGGNVFESNELVKNGVGAYLTAGSEANVFTENRFEGNLVQVYQGHAGGNRWSRDRKGNFWSDYVGFDWDGDGVGEAPYRLQTAASALLARRPEARWFWVSPILALLDWWEARILTPSPGTLDRYPVVRRSAGSLRAGPGDAP